MVKEKMNVLTSIILVILILAYLLNQMLIVCKEPLSLWRKSLAAVLIIGGLVLSYSIQLTVSMELTLAMVTVGLIDLLVTHRGLGRHYLLIRRSGYGLLAWQAVHHYKVTVYKKGTRVEIIDYQGRQYNFYFNQQPNQLQNFIELRVASS